MDISNEELQMVSALARKQRDLEQQVFEAEAALKTLKESLEHTRTVELPNALAECGMTAFTLESGQKIEIKPHYYGSISEENKPQAFGWLRRNNLDGVIKNVITCDFGKGEDEEARRVMDQLSLMGIRPQQKESVHPMTLKSLVRDLIERGVEFPMELFGAGVKNEAKITEPKK